MKHFGMVLVVLLCAVATVATAVEPTTKPQIVKRWKSKSGSPPEVAAFVATWPQLRLSEIVRLENERKSRSIELSHELQAQIDDAQRETDELKARKRYKTVTTTMGHTKQVLDSEWEREKSKQLLELRKKIGVAKKQLKQLNDGTHDELIAIDDELRKLRVDPLWKPVGKPLEMRVGSFGWLPRPLRVIQVIDNSSALVEFNGEIWARLRGIDFSNQVDDERVSYAGSLAVVGTYSYTTTLGSKKTVYDAVSMILDLHLELEEVVAPK